jgi:hypothetical protein
MPDSGDSNQPFRFGYSSFLLLRCNDRRKDLWYLPLNAGAWLAAIFAGSDQPLAVQWAQWARSSRRFWAFAADYRATIRCALAQSGGPAPAAARRGRGVAALPARGRCPGVRKAKSPMWTQIR